MVLLLRLNDFNIGDMIQYLGSTDTYINISSLSLLSLYIEIIYIYILYHIYALDMYKKIWLLM